LVITREEIVMAVTCILKFDDIAARQMPNGATIRPLVDKASCDARIKTNTVTFPPGHAVEFHRHNCNEMIVVLEGDCAVETETLPQTRLKPFDTVSVAAGTWHRFLNLGTTPFTLLAIYDAEQVERTLKESGMTTID
jgi:quercetin dioxygenase-like cupin family protein